MLKVANDGDFKEKVLENERVVLVDFYATWCGPCAMQAPVLEEIANSRVEFDIVKVNVDESPKVSEHYGIDTIPTLVIFKNGKEATRNVGYMNKDNVIDMLSSEF